MFDSTQKSTGTTKSNKKLYIYDDSNRSKRAGLKLIIIVKISRFFEPITKWFLIMPISFGFFVEQLKVKHEKGNQVENNKSSFFVF